jgi:tetratricopeptide (TPR) repeat protein
VSTNTDKKLESLEAKLEANPASKIFLPLAEQHRLQGNLQRAAAVLQVGLKHNPAYNVARVALGRVHLELGELTEGRRLLTKLLLEVPDNLLARKLLDDAGGPLQEPPTAAQDDPATGPEPMGSGPHTADGGPASPAHEVPEAEDSGTHVSVDDGQASPEPEEDESLDYEVPEAEDLGFHVMADDDLHEEEPDSPALRDEAGADLGEAAARSESVWTDPHADPAEPPAPEPGVWKEDDEAITRTWDDPAGEVNPPPSPDFMVDPAEEREAVPPSFETVQLQRSDLLPASSVSQECQDEPDEAELEAELEVEEAAPEADAAGPVAETGATLVMDQEAGSGASLEMETTAVPDTVTDLPAATPMAAGLDAMVNESPADVDLVENEPLMAGTSLVTPPPAEDGELGPVAISDTATPAMRTAVSLADEEEADRTLSLARLYRRQGRLDLSADVYREILDADPEHPAARRELEELCGRNVPEITDEDLVPEAAVFPEGVQLASTERLEDARKRKITFLRAWLEHIRQQD